MIGMGKFIPSSQTNHISGHKVGQQSKNGSVRSKFLLKCMCGDNFAIIVLVALQC